MLHQLNYTQQGMKKESSSTVYELIEDGIIYGELKEGASVDIDSTVERLKLMREMVPNGKIYLLSNITGIKGSSKEARKYSLDNEFTSAMGAVAIITQSSISKIIANFVLSMYKTAYGMKLFTDEEKALTWLRSMRDKNS